MNGGGYDLCMDEGALWKAVATFGGVLVAGGVAVVSVTPELARILVAGGCVVFLLGLALYWHERRTWTRSPRLPRGMRCSHFPARYYPGADYPHAQEVDIFIERDFYPPDFRVLCNAPILAVEGDLQEFEPVDSESTATISLRKVTRHHSGTVAGSLLFPPLEPIQHPAFLHLIVYSDQPIRVLRVKHLPTKYPDTGGDG